MTIFGYVRVSTEKQKTKNQKLAILEYANKKKVMIDDWIDVTASTRKDPTKRKIDILLGKVDQGDTVIVCELSRIGRSVGQVALIVNGLIEQNVKLVSLKENLEICEKQSIQSKVMITMFSLFAEIERDLISERVKEGVDRARKEGKRIGRPKGPGKSKLDGKENEILTYLEKGVSKASIAKILDVSWPCLNNFIKTRRLK